MDRADIEGDALAIYRLARLEPDEPVAMSRLVRRLLQTEVREASFERGKAHLTRVGDDWWIYVQVRMRPVTSSEALRFPIRFEPIG